MKKSNIARLTLDTKRMSDSEYIIHLENTIQLIDERIEEFTDLMDKAIFSRESLAPLNTYVENISLLRL